jgi:hypothetical protein
MAQDNLLKLMLKYKGKKFGILEFCKFTGLSRSSVGNNLVGLRKQTGIYNISITVGKRGKLLYSIV